MLEKRNLFRNFILLFNTPSSKQVIVIKVLLMPIRVELGLGHDKGQGRGDQVVGAQHDVEDLNKFVSVVNKDESLPNIGPALAQRLDQ